MTTNSNPTNSSPPDLPTYLFARREAILDNWQATCEQDAMLETVAALSREEFTDMMPTILNILSQQLRGEAQDADPLQVASEHGLHRWQIGYTLRELLREVGHLHRGLSDELQTYWSLYPTTDPTVLIAGYQRIAEINQAIVEGSVARYDELERTAAASRADTIQEALNQMSQLSQQRTDMLRTSSHDLRSSFGIIQGAAFMLNLEDQSPEERGRLMDMLNRNLTNIQVMLQNLMSLARLDAGQDPPELVQLDVAAMLRDLVQSAQPIATQRGLTLFAQGPENLVAESDSVKIQRIVQNILVNALTYTSSGVVSVSWSRENDFRWAVSVQDSGPGLPSRVVQTLASSLKPTTESASIFQSQLPAEPPVDESSGPPRKPVAKRSKGEGIGLHIVKRLCEVLEASVDVETAAGQGTLIRIRFPIRYKR